MVMKMMMAINFFSILGTFQWQATIPDMTAEVPCPNGGGLHFSGGDPSRAKARRTCLEGGRWQTPQTEACDYADEATRMLEKIAMVRKNMWELKDHIKMFNSLYT